MIMFVRLSKPLEKKMFKWDLEDLIRKKYKLRDNIISARHTTIWRDTT